MEEGKKETLTIQDEGGNGFIRISDDVVADIAALAVTEVDGVAHLTGGVSDEVVSKISRKKLSKGIRVIFDEEGFRVDVSAVVKFGYNIVEVSTSIQEKVKQALQTMTGLMPAVVNVRVSGVDFSG